MRACADVTGMRGERTSVLRTSWLATAFGALLALTVPVAASVAGASAAAAPAVSAVSVSGDPVAVASAVGTHRTAPSGPRSSATAPSSAGHSGASAAPSKPKPSNAPAPAGAPKATSPISGTQVLVHLGGSVVAHRSPWGSSAAVGTVVGTSRYYHVPLVAWVEQVSSNGKWGLVELPYVWPRTEGWIPLGGLQRESSSVAVTVDLSEHRVRVWRQDTLLYSVSAATGAFSTPTPVGDYFVTDRVPFSAGSSYGTFAFGISGIQPHLPPGWSGGNQLAIHGTNAPSSIGTNASAGCVRVSEWTLSKLLPLLRFGTPVVIEP
jgi:lipoprotein-anchoring transpeptidase ErfK/SrfK